MAVRVGECNLIGHCARQAPLHMPADYVPSLSFLRSPHTHSTRSSTSPALSYLGAKAHLLRDSGSSSSSRNRLQPQRQRKACPSDSKRCRHATKRATNDIRCTRDHSHDVLSEGQQPMSSTLFGYPMPLLGTADALTASLHRRNRHPRSSAH